MRENNFYSKEYEGIIGLILCMILAPVFLIFGALCMVILCVLSVPIVIVILICEIVELLYRIIRLLINKSKIKRRC